MKVGDAVRHKDTGHIALVLRTISNCSNFPGMVDIMTIKGQGVWLGTKCEVINESR
jgi:hypothetical protein